MGAPTSILVRTQANGGMFIGPDAGYTYVTIRDAGTQAVLAQGLALGDSGKLVTKSETGIGPVPIYTPGKSAPMFVYAKPSTAGLMATVDLASPTEIEITVEGMMNGTPNGSSVTGTFLISPGQPVETGIVFVMYGLRVGIVEPVTPAKPTNPFQLQAWVTMACGCQIKPDTLWLPEEFTVSAELFAVESGDHLVLPLAFANPNQASVFQTESVELPPGYYQVTITAQQPLANNTGTFFTALTIPPLKSAAESS